MLDISTTGEFATLIGSVIFAIIGGTAAVLGYKNPEKIIVNRRKEVATVLDREDHQSILMSLKQLREELYEQKEIVKHTRHQVVDGRKMIDHTHDTVISIVGSQKTLAETLARIETKVDNTHLRVALVESKL
jgi:gamma-glutamylcysteine synthetase